MDAGVEVRRAAEALRRLRADAQRRSGWSLPRARSLREAEELEVFGRGAEIAEVRENGLTGKSGAVSRGSRNGEG